MLPRPALGLAGALALVGILGSSTGASAHALLQTSDPAAGAILDHSPAAVTISFGERPDPKLSSIHVLDSGGQDYSVGAAQPVPADSLKLRVGVKTLPKGVYTVTWRTLSAVDGHIASGSYAFGVQVVPPASLTRALPSPSSPSNSPLGVIARWLLYSGLVVLVGTAFVATMVRLSAPMSLVRLVPLSWAVALAGALGVVEVQSRDAGISLSQLAGSSLAEPALFRLVPLTVAMVGVVLAIAGKGPARRLGFTVAGAGAAGAMLGDVLGGHAAAATLAPLNILAQWLHVVAVGVWMGGLLALLLAIRGLPGREKGAAIRRFSSVAGLALATVAVTGTIRAAVELGRWGALTSTDFGLLVILKVVLFLVLALLGAVNRFRNVPAAERLLGGLRRVGSIEVVIAAGVIALTGALVNVAPPAYSVNAQQGPQPLVVAGADFATTVRVRLEVSPGTAGFNTFSLRVTNYDTGAPVDAAGVQISFTFQGQAGVGGSTLELKRSGAGTYVATGGNLALDGDYAIRILVERGAASVEVPLKLTTRSVPQTVDVNRAAGQPTLYTIHLGQGRTIQDYVDPEHSGPSEFHATFFDAAGNELAVNQAVITETSGGGKPVPLTIRELEPGHFVADATLRKGKQHFDITGTGSSGELLRAGIDVSINQ